MDALAVSSRGVPSKLVVSRALLCRKHSVASSYLYTYVEKRHDRE
jgi:hypothetical protein